MKLVYELIISRVLGLGEKKERKKEREKVKSLSCVRLFATP